MAESLINSIAGGPDYERVVWEFLVDRGLRGFWCWTEGFRVLKSCGPCVELMCWTEGILCLSLKSCILSVLKNVGFKGDVRTWPIIFDLFRHISSDEICRFRKPLYKQIKNPDYIKNICSSKPIIELSDFLKSKVVIFLTYSIFFWWNLSSRLYDLK